MARIISAEEKARLKGEFFEEAEKGFERMFYDGTLDELVTFTQREDRAIEITDKLWSWLMEKHIEKDEWLDASEVTGRCPKCDVLCRSRKGHELKELERREIIGRRGEVGYERKGYYCTNCRIAFFPSGQKDEARHRRIQPKHASED